MRAQEKEEGKKGRQSGRPNQSPQILQVRTC